MTVHVSVLLKAPRIGFVKSRLATEIGEQQALRLYRVMAARTLAAVKAAGLPATIWYAPAEAAPEMRRWLGDEWSLRPQASGDLGARLAAASRSVEAGEWWLGVGGDCPDLRASHLHQACDLLRRYRVVLGPGHDGGYYLIGGWVPLPDLFTDMPWSSDRLLMSTRARLEELGMSHAELTVLRDVDTAADARATGLLT